MRRLVTMVLAILMSGSGAAFAERPAMNPTQTNTTHAVAMFGSGCFWCAEAVFQRMTGVVAVTSGYAGGKVAKPSYRQVCSGETGHAEVVRVDYDPATVSYDQLLDLFWRMHDPTTLNRQGPDVGTQYRSVIFWFTEAQKAAAERSKAALNVSGKRRDPVVTEIAPAPTFYPAEDYHQDYFDQNRNAPYCRAVILPKLEKLGIGK